MLENQRAQTEEVLSKRSLQIILRLEELQWSQTPQVIQQRDKISEQVEYLIDLKIQFNKIHVPQINQDFRELITLSHTVTRHIRNNLYVWLQQQKEILIERAKIVKFNETNGHQFRLPKLNKIKTIREEDEDEDKASEEDKKEGE